MLSQFVEICGKGSVVGSRLVKCIWRDEYE